MSRAFIIMGNRQHKWGVPRSPVRTRSYSRAACAPPVPQIETRASRKLREGAGTCPICLEEGPTVRPDPCEHMFHLQCLMEWSTRENSCPVCRAFFNHIMPGAIPVEDAVQVDEE